MTEGYMQKKPLKVIIKTDVLVHVWNSRDIQLSFMNLHNNLVTHICT